MFSKLFSFMAVLGMLLLGTAACAVSSDNYDLVIIGGRVVDPETGLDGIRNVGITGGRISVVTTETITGTQTVDATGKIVSPGFIDMHAHGQSIPAGRLQALDGVTTALELEGGVLPVSSFYEHVAREGRPINYGASVNWAGARIAAILDVEPEPDIYWFLKNFNNRKWQNEIANPKQLERISSLVQQGLDEGGLGIGMLLGYAPGTGRKEYFRVSEIAAENKVPTFTHARFLSVIEPESSFEGMSEIVSAAAGSGVHAHIVHLNSMSLRDIELIAGLIKNAQERGLKITTEAYPYGAGSTGIGAAMFLRERWRERLGGVTAHNFDVGGSRLSEEKFTDLQENKPETVTIIHFLDLEKEEDQEVLDKSVLFPGGVIASDGGEWMIDDKFVDKDVWPIPDNAWSHPRGAGTYAKFLRTYVREQQRISLLEAIERVSFGPARILQDSVPQMRNKGRLQSGADADIVVFDLNEVTDNATYAQPARSSSGFEFVIVNGVLLVRNGELDVSVLPGKAIRNPVK